MPRVMVLVQCTSPQWDLSAYEILSQKLESFLSYAPDKIQEWKWTKGNNSKSMKLWVLWFLCILLLLNEIYLPMKFHVDALHCFESYAPDKKVTGRQTDGQVDYYMPLFGGIKSNLFADNLVLV